MCHACAPILCSCVRESPPTPGCGQPLRGRSFGASLHDQASQVPCCGGNLGGSVEQLEIDRCGLPSAWFVYGCTLVVGTQSQACPRGARRLTQSASHRETKDFKRTSELIEYEDVAQGASGLWRSKQMIPFTCRVLWPALADANAVCQTLVSLRRKRPG